MIAAIILSISIAASLAWLWSGGIDYMNKTHPKYEGEDFLKWDVNNTAGRDGWDDTLNHTEGEI